MPTSRSPPPTDSKNDPAADVCPETLPSKAVYCRLFRDVLGGMSPPVLANGALNFSAPSSEAILSYDTTLRQLSRTVENRSIAYTLDFRSPHSAEPEFTGVGRAWAQSSIIELED